MPLTETSEIDARRRAMRTLALAAPEALEAAYAGFAGLPDWHFARRPETGLVMVRGRIGGGGGPFNLGEMSVTRAAVTLATGETGHAYVAGRNQRKAAIAAVFDALWQNAGLRPRIEDEIIAPLGAARDDADRRGAEQAAATRVDFFTLVRGDD
ncbi:MAG: phosphonate C-P lyase system protein PhnG [Alphaproteobacteria bacterium]|nr:phosphonate C-P lyase system protein PhnG [Alphaproteobacteria bacterium]